MTTHATLSPVLKGRDATNSRKLTCSGCGHVSTPGPMALHRCDPGYTGVHLRIVRQRGSAKTHSCVDCGSQAFDWSYNYRDPDERVSEEGRYSLNIDNYEPRCRSCHLTHDGEKDPNIGASRSSLGKALGSSGAGARATARRWGK